VRAPHYRGLRSVFASIPRCAQAFPASDTPTPRPIFFIHAHSLRPHSPSHPLPTHTSSPAGLPPPPFVVARLSILVYSKYDSSPLVAYHPPTDSASLCFPSARTHGPIESVSGIYIHAWVQRKSA
jgi:hypothetical protein